MRKSLIHLSLLICAILALHPVWLAAATPPTRISFAHENSDLPVDSAVRFGELPNGFRYAILQNKEPKERASLRLVIVAGSLQEEETQRGLAHYLEHLAFSGSKHYPPGTLVEFFQRMGMSFGGDTNAYTSFDRTVYMIDLPDTKAETIAEGLTVFADYANELFILEEQVEKERGIILAEKRTRDSVNYRQFIAEFEFILKGTLPPRRLPIGEERVIKETNRERLVDFYNTWYRPERMAVVAVGDFDADMMERQIKDKLSAFSARAPERKDNDLGTLPKFEGVRFMAHHEAEAANTQVSIQSISAWENKGDTRETRLEKLPRDLAFSILNRRLAILAKAEDARFTMGVAGLYEGFDFFLNPGIVMTCAPQQWQDALATAEQELRRVIEHGFTQAELNEARANMLNNLERAVAQAPSRRSDILAGGLVDALVDNEVFTTPSEELALYKPALEEITPEDCAAALRKTFGGQARFVTVIGNADLGATAEALIRKTYEDSQAVPVSAPEKTEGGSFAYTHFGKDSAMTSEQYIEDLDLWLASYANGVRVNFKKTDFEADSILIHIRIGGGQLIEPKDKAGLSTFSSSTLIQGGLGKHSADDLQRILAGKTVRTSFNVTDDALAFSARTNKDNLLLQLQLIAAYLTDAGYRPESARLARKSFEEAYTQLRHHPAGPLNMEMPRMLADGDPRFGMPREEELLARTLEESREWLGRQFKDAAMEIAVVGDIEWEDAKKALAQTLAALPPRQARPDYAEERVVRFPSVFSKTFTVDTEIPKAYVVFYWPTTDGRDIRKTRRLSMLNSVLNDRLRIKIREQLGDAYSPHARSETSDTYHDYGMIYATVIVDPEKTEAVAKALASIADDLVENGITDDELERAKKPILTGLKESVRTNGYWLHSVLSNAQELPQRLDWSRSRYQDFESIKKEEIDALAKEYLPSKRAFRAIVIPEKKD